MINKLKAHVEAQGYPAFTEEINYINAHNFHIYRDNLKLDVPETFGTGCTYKNGKVTVKHSAVKNAVAFETYNADGQLLRITMYGLGSDDDHSFTQVLYPGGTEPANASAYIMAMGYDGTRMKIYEKENVQKTLTANRYYRMTARNGALSCGAGTMVVADGTIKWSFARAPKSTGKADQVWMWQKRGDDTYLYNPQSGYYFGGKTNAKTDELYAEKDAPAWEAICIDENQNTYTFNIKGSGNYMNAYSETNTGLWTGGASDANNVWTVEEVTTFPITIPSYQYAVVCYPFPLETAEGVTAYIISGKGTYKYEGTDYEYALLEEVFGDIVPAHMPVVYSGKADTYNLNIVPEDNTAPTTPNLLHGATLKTILPAGTFLGTVAQSTEAGTTASIKSTSSGTQVPANKAYLLTSEVEDATLLYFGLKTTLTGIDKIEGNKGGQQFFHLDGTQATTLQKGKIYVTSDGKKLLVK